MKILPGFLPTAKMVQFIVNHIIPEGVNLKDPLVRHKVGIKEGYFSILGNLVLFIVKVIIGILSHSIAVLADAFHSLLDMATSGIVIFGFKISQKPADAEHPYGHGRAETVASLIIAFIIGYIGIEFLKTSVHRIFNEEALIISPWMIFVVSATIIIKEIMARVSLILGDAIDSEALKADALHHKSDVWSSVLVILGLMSAQFGFTQIDSYMGIGVSLFILYAGFEIAKKAVDDLLGRAPDKEYIEEIKDIATSVNHVLNVHDIIVHQYGTQKFISLHIEVSDVHTAETLHHIADTVEKEIGESLFADVVTHIDPVKTDGKLESEVKKIIQPIIEEWSDIDIQDLRLNGDVEDCIDISFEVSCPIEFQYEKDVINKLSEHLTEKFTNSRININFKRQIVESELKEK
ncbi:MAG: cation diffusion facilitator family transporter [Candidatus Marinimicrobia bacterium]|nr:cation diffusion facilitator family transporter [Candidatus Neomarinimicrobiota bacterium]